jgi:hypothetical protein
VIAFDFDGVLSELCSGEVFSKPYSRMTGPERQRRAEFLLDHYSKALPILSPVANEFAVITARKAEPRIFEVSRAWLNRHFPGKKTSLYMLPDARSIPNVVSFKGSIIRALGVTDFVEDNVKVVAGLRKSTSARIWLYQGGQLTL